MTKGVDSANVDLIGGERQRGGEGKVEKREWFPMPSIKLAEKESELNIRGSLTEDKVTV